MSTIIQQKIGNISNYKSEGKSIDILWLHWFETNKRIQRKRTQSGKELALKFLNNNPLLTQGDILFEDNESIVIVEVFPCDCLVASPKNMFEMASICYEIGNKHLPLFFENDELLVPFENQLFNLLSVQGYAVKKEQRKLLQALKTTVAPHGNGGESLFSKILNFTASNE